MPLVQGLCYWAGQLLCMPRSLRLSMCRVLSGLQCQASGLERPPRAEALLEEGLAGLRLCIAKLAQIWLPQDLVILFVILVKVKPKLSQCIIMHNIPAPKLYPVSFATYKVRE